MISLGAACVRCPQCDGERWNDAGRPCRVCADDERPAYAEPLGYLDLPLAPWQAEAIYTSGNAECGQLVNTEPPPVHLLLGAPARTACGRHAQDDGGADIDAARVTCPACYVAVEVNHELAAVGGDR